MSLTNMQAIQARLEQLKMQADNTNTETQTGEVDPVAKKRKANAADSMTRQNQERAAISNLYPFLTPQLQKEYDQKKGGTPASRMLVAIHEMIINGDKLGHLTPSEATAAEVKALRDRVQELERKVNKAVKALTDPNPDTPTFPIDPQLLA